MFWTALAVAGMVLLVAGAWVAAGFGAALGVAGLSCIVTAIDGRR